MAARAVWVGGSEHPEAIESRLEVAPQLQRIETLVESFELRVRGARENPGGREALVGRLGLIKPAMHTGPVAGFTDELLDGLEEVHVQAGELIDAGQLSIGGFGGKAIIADELAHDGAVLLPDIQLVATSTAQRVKRKKPPGGAASMGDQIHLEEARARIVPLGEGANGDLLLEPGAGPRGRGPAQWVAGARRR